MVVGIIVGLGPLYVMWCDRTSGNGLEVDIRQVTEEKSLDQPQGDFDLFD